MIKKELLHFTLYATIIYLTGGLLASAVASPASLWGHGTHSHGHRDLKVPDNRNYARTSAANLNRGEPRTVRMIYFLPSDRPYQAEVVQRMKEEIRTVQTFFADQMEARGYGRATFRVETDSQGEPMVHRVDGRYPDSHYFDNTDVYADVPVRNEIKLAFDLVENVYLIVVDNRRHGLSDTAAGIGARVSKTGGEAMSSEAFNWFLFAHELGHAFGLQHDFSNNAYIMSYGDEQNRLSQCHAEYLSVHPYFNPDMPIEEGPAPRIELLSPHTYTGGETSVPIQLEISDPEGLQQVILHAAQPDNRWSVKACRGLGGKKETVIEFDYDGVIPSAHDPFYSENTSLLNPLVHPIVIEAIDMNGDVDSSMWGGGFRFVLFPETLQPLSKISGDNQAGLPNTALPVPFVVEVRDLNDGFAAREIPITFSVTAGGGTLSVEHTATDWNGRAESVLTLGPNFGTNTVLVTAAGIGEVTFNAVGVPPIDIPDQNLRTAIEDALAVSPGTPIAPADMATLTRLEAGEVGIRNLTGLESATNLETLSLRLNSISDLTPLSGLTNLRWLGLTDNSISDISAVAGLTSLTELHLGGNNISDISPVADLPNLTWLHLPGNNISDASVVAGLTRLTYLNLNGTNSTDLSVVSGLTNLTWLGFGSNGITDISVLSGLTKLTGLWLSNNSITDISPLLGLTNLKELRLSENPLSDQSINTHIPFLQSRGVEVKFDNRLPTDEMVQGDVPFANEPFDVNNIPEPVPPPKEVRDFFDLSDFWQQWINIEGFPVLGSAAASPYAVKELAWQIGQMFRGKTELLKELAKNKHTYTVIGHDEVFGDIPEMHQLPHLRPSLLFYHNVRAGGGWSPRLGSSEVSIFRSASTPIHELAHDIHLFVFNRLDSTFDDRLKALYDMVIAKGLWYGAASDYKEYWAEGVTVWFHVPQLSPVKTREALKAYDPDIALLIAEVFGDNDWRYTPIRKRTHLPHLQGFDPQSAPLDRELPPGVREAYEELRDPAINERDEWVNLPPYDPSLLPRLNELRNRNQADRYSVGRTDVLVANTIDDQIWLYWVNPDGTETLRWRIHPKAWAIAHLSCRVGDLLLAKDSTGRPLAVFQAVEKVGRVLLAPTFHLIKPGLSKVSGDNQRGVSGAVLSNSFVIEVRGESLSVLEGISVTLAVTAGDGTLSVTRATTNANGRAQSTLTLGPNRGTNTVSVSAAGIAESVIFSAVAEGVVDIPDRNLRAAIENALGKPKNNPITPSEMETLTRLEAKNANISDLTGLEGANNLTYLDLGFVDAEGRRINSNSASNLSPLVGLTQLTYLNLWGNSISNISPLAGLTRLTQLELSDNSISDISSVAGLTNLTYLDLDVNRISDISGVSGLTNLKRLEIGNNNLSDLSPLTNLTKLTILWFYGNNISDLSPLVTNTGLRRGDRVVVIHNPLSYVSIHTHIPRLQQRGVTVEFDNQAHPALLKISGDNQKGASFAPLSQPFVVEAQDASGSVLVGVSVRFAVTAGGGTFNTTITRTNPNGRAQSTLTLGPNLGTNTVEVSATGIKAPVTFHAISDTEAPPITADVNNDGTVNILDLVVITSNLDTKGTNLAADVNRDGIVNILDLVLTVGMFEEAAAAPSTQPQVPETLTAVEVQGWLTNARALEVRDPIMKRGFVVLEQLLASLTPKETELLSNYPNPFNPETWIPYRLAEDAYVTLTIYDRAGQVVRTLDVGHRIASAYENRSKAIYWDGRNNLGETVASGIYFYHLSAGRSGRSVPHRSDYATTRKMLIIK